MRIVARLGAVVLRAFLRFGARAALAAAALATGCAAPSGRPEPATTLSDRALVDAFVAVGREDGVAVDSIALLAALEAPPAYVVTSSSATCFGEVAAQEAVYTLPTATVRAAYDPSFVALLGSDRAAYHHLDRRAFARMVAELSVPVLAQEMPALRARGSELLGEIRARSERREHEGDALLAAFLARHPQLSSRRLLLAAVLAWVDPSARDAAPAAALEAAAQRIDGRAPSRGVGGSWYGVTARLRPREHGEIVAYEDFLRVDLVEDGSDVHGHGALASGAEVEIAATVADGGDLNGVCVARPADRTTKLRGRVDGDRLVCRFVGIDRAAGVEGTAILVR